MKNNFDKKDFIWFSIFAVAIMVFSSLPYFVAQSLETDDLLFRGTYFDEVDYSVHISMMQAGRMGDWAYQMRFTSEEHQPAYLRMFYIILGHISKWIKLSAEATFHLARWVLGFIALFSIYQLCSKLFEDKKLARTAFLLVSIGGGAGLLQLIFAPPAPLEDLVPIDFSLIDAYIFFSVSMFPAFSFTLALMAFSLSSFVDYLNTDEWKKVALICLLAALSQVTNPIAFAVVDLAFAAAVFALWWKNRKIQVQNLYALSAIALAQIPLLAYNFIILNRDPLWSQFTLQNKTLSPPPEYYVWGFAPFWLPAIYGIFLAFRKKDQNMIGMSIWVISGFALAYAPLLIQRRFLLGITIPLGILAIFGLEYLLKKASLKMPALSSRKAAVYFAYLLFSSFSILNLSLGSSFYLKTYPIEKFYPRDLENALLWLDENAPPNDFVLGNIRTGQIIGQRTRLKTYIAHPMETLYLDDKVDAVEAYYQGNAPDNWIQETPIHWVIYSIYEEEFTTTFIPGPELELAYENETVLIYKVKH